MRRAKQLFLAMVFLLVCSASAAGQVATGTPLFGSFSGGPDIVNNADLNVHLQVPIEQKNGFVPFYYILTYDSSVWYPVGSSGNQSWQPVSGYWGWQTLTPVVTGSVTFNTTQESCRDPLGDFYYYNLYSNFVYTDPQGVVHGATNPADVRPLPECPPEHKLWGERGRVGARGRRSAS